MEEATPSKRQTQRDQTRASMLKTARTIFTQSGFRATTIRQVAKAANVGTGTVLAHFGSKEGLLYSVLHDDIEKIAERSFADLKPNQPIDEALQEIGISFLNGYAEEPDLYADFLEHSLFARGDWGERFRKQVESAGIRIGQLFANACERGEIPQGTDIRVSTLTFFANYYFVLIGQIKSRFTDIDDGQALLKVLVEHQIEGLRK